MGRDTLAEDVDVTLTDWVFMWAEVENWPASDWDYTEWEECLESYKKYIDNRSKI